MASALVLKLGRLLNRPPLAVELLPGDGSEWFTADTPPEAAEHAPFLFVDGHLGVPLKVAYKAYLESIPIFKRCRTSLLRQRTSTSHPHSLEAGDLQDLLASSAVLLLANPAHQSALNARCRLVQLGNLEAADELKFVTALLTLRDGAKQSNLWHHRRWLLRRIHSSSQLANDARNHSAGDRGHSQDGEDSLLGISLDAGAFSAEFGIAEQACEIYPRNYYAWTHRYLCTEALVICLGQHSAGSQDSKARLADVWQVERRRSREWIERHVSDYSAMQYANRLESLHHGLENTVLGSLGSSREPPDKVEEPASHHAWHLVQAFPAHESLWLYLRGALFLHFTGPDAHDPGTEPSGRVLKEAKAFAERLLSDENGVGTVSSVSPGERALVRNHAVRFLSWVLWQERGISVDGETVRRVSAAAASEDVANLQAFLQSGRNA
ncbi:protein prenylyltransferase [Cubamyces sp. BRFM 1775]|nr:protein prenylyltransferase [Cubamyces sp. BRFM 1775]